MSNYKLTFNPKQQTPIIHFQHDPMDATLRARELKPGWLRRTIIPIDLKANQ
ncbi:MAG: hypothetical protein WD077_10495 [Bacteroidia bacterium]